MASDLNKMSNKADYDKVLQRQGQAPPPAPETGSCAGSVCVQAWGAVCLLRACEETQALIIMGIILKLSCHLSFDLMYSSPKLLLFIFIN